MTTQPKAPDGEIARKAKEMLDRAIAVLPQGSRTDNALREMKAVAALVPTPDDLRAEIILQLCAREKSQWMEVQVLGMVARKRLALDPDQLIRLLAGLNPQSAHAYWSNQAIFVTVGLLEFNYPRLGAADQARVAKSIERLIGQFSEMDATESGLVRLKRLLEGDSLDLTAMLSRDGVGPRAREIVSSVDSSDASNLAFLDHLLTLANRQSAKWTAAATTLAAKAACAPAVVAQMLQAALNACNGVDAKGRPQSPNADLGNGGILLNALAYAGILRDPANTSVLEQLAEKCTQVVEAYCGPRDLSVANASVRAIAAIGDGAALTALRTLERKVRHGGFLREVAKGIHAIATSQGKSRSELLETAVEDHGLDESGGRIFALASYTAEVRLADNDVTVTWRDAAGKVLKSAPAAAKASNPAEYKAVQATVKAIGQSIAAERVRLDGLLVENREWDLGDWQTNYLRHPVTGALARALIWRFAPPNAADRAAEVVGLPRLDGLVHTVAGVDVAPPAGARVRLWHPLDGSPADVQAWRQAILAERIRQPFKQAFRETYTITPAEIETRTYSNRFAAHVFRQVQARSLMKGRGWSAVVLAWWDDGVDHGVAKKTYAAHGNIRAEFFYDPIVDIQPAGGSDSYPYCTTDQVRFFADGDRRLDLADVPTLVFSEAMRDVDLFVGVTSIGADPNWLDQGERRFDTYWHKWGFGDLSAGAAIRREVLASMLPALAIADKCSLQDRFLEVRGELRTYKIHLGSGNILMSPDDRYLCIVAERGSPADRVFLPFDDDPVLSIVLSKAMLLADDTAIKDATIVRQIRPSA